MLSVSRPIEEVVLNCWVTDTKRDSSGIESLHDLGKVGEAARQTVNFVYDDDIHFVGFDVREQTFQSRALHRPTGVSPIVVAGGNDAPAFLALAQNKGF
jgi:hypothetical protein